MLLIGVKDDNLWLFSRWNLTYGCGWGQILKGVSSVYDYYQHMEILINDKVLDIKDRILESQVDLHLEGYQQF